jgi:hypothetical protein
VDSAGRRRPAACPGAAEARRRFRWHEGTLYEADTTLTRAVISEPKIPLRPPPEVTAPARARSVPPPARRPRHVDRRTPLFVAGALVAVFAMAGGYLLATWARDPTSTLTSEGIRAGPR